MGRVKGQETEERQGKSREGQGEGGKKGEIGEGWKRKGKSHPHGHL